MAEQKPLLPPVSLTDSFVEILGEHRGQMPDEVRRDRWEKWKELCRQSDAPELVRYWTDTEGCEGCRHLDGDWCQLQQLPCSVNPILTFRSGLIGMACMGLGYEARE